MIEVPHLTTALTGPLLQIEKQLLINRNAIEAWFREQWQITPAPLTCSVDLRNAGFKLAPVDTNLFPAGFNNLSPDLLPLCIQAAQATIQFEHPTCKRILIIPESHTKQVYYYESLAVLFEILTKAGFDVRIGSLLTGLKQAKTVKLPSGKQIILEPVTRGKDCLQLVDGFKPCLIILNNDLSGGIEPMLQGLKQKIRPPVALGWSERLKSTHFNHYQQVAEIFAEKIAIDPWLINPAYSVCDQIDFVTREGESCVIANAEQLLKKIKDKYQQYNIDRTPFLVVKADAGTYGLGIMMIKDPQEIRELNRKQRAKMSTLKGARKLSRVIIQEGVYTFESLGEEQAVAEPVVYMIGNYVIGGFYRVHKALGQDENLNAPGMHFEPLAFAKPCNDHSVVLTPEENINRFYAYGVIARLALLAAARELAEVRK